MSYFQVIMDARRYFGSVGVCVALCVSSMAGIACGPGGSGSTTLAASDAGRGGSTAKGVGAAIRRQIDDTGPAVSKEVFCRRGWVGSPHGEEATAKLLLNRWSAPPGGRIHAYLENVGSTVLKYEMIPAVDRLANGRWVPQRFVRDGVRVGFPTSSLELMPESTSTCVEVPVSDTWQTGLYRVWIPVVPAGDSTEAPERPAAYFRVNPA